ncbi:chaperonin GroEL [Candidatus Chlamydia sanziniae]|uniref:60 kDa chaperonin n=1 Tax=Candidatus Chlamydia sanziniae TaxID=1806891 RepID=A0A1A9HUB5_9CHLA|nr:chaperonin GroEL [Candidatus Chlamydia sanziniae]ANH78578.1 Heat shock protein 60 family chaperone GroEL [Candidatus Chlamydia sanziniae]
MARIFKSRFEGLIALQRGVRTLAKAVTLTLGPQGCNVVIKKGKNPVLVTRNGATVAKEIVLADPFENLGIKLAREAAIKAVDYVGDGSTTVIVLIDALFSAGLKGVAIGLDPQEIRAGILLATEALIEELKKQRLPIQSSEDLIHIATIAANQNTATGIMIADALTKVGPEGIISISQDQGKIMSLEIVSGINFKSGYLSPYFVTRPETMDIFWENASLLLLDQNVFSLSKPFIDYLTLISAESSHPVIIVAHDFDKEVLATLVVNKLKMGLSLCAVKAPGFGEHRQAILEDLAILTGATLISDRLGSSLEQASLDILGYAHKVTITKESVVFLNGGGNSEAIENRVHYLRETIARNRSGYEIQELEKRLAKFVGRMARIQLSSETETEFQEEKNRFTAALRATKAALKEGIVPGGGVALLQAAASVQSSGALASGVAFGFDSLLLAVQAPLKILVQNCGKVPEATVHRILSQKNPYFGYNGIKDTFENLISAGIYDPFMVTTASLKYAVSVSCLLLTSSFFMADAPIELTTPSPPEDFFME